MLITNYATLQSAVGEWLARGDLTSSIPGFIQNFEERFYRQPKNYGYWLEAQFMGTVASAVIPVPVDYLSLKYAYINSSPSSRLDRVSLNQMIGTYPRNGCTGKPVFIARNTNAFIFGPEPDYEYDVAGVYYAKPITIRDSYNDGADHWLILNAPDLVLYGALLEATPFLQNDRRIGVWQIYFDKSLKDYRDLMREEDQSGGPTFEVLV